MYKKGDYLFHKNYGIIIINDIVECDLGNGMNLYYNLSKVNSPDVVFASFPVSNLSSVREPMDRKTALFIVKNLHKLDEIWAGDNKRRKEIFAEIFAEGDPVKIASLASTLRNKRIEFVAVKKNLPISDTKTFERASKLIKSELNYVLKDEYKKYEDELKEYLGNF